MCRVGQRSANVTRASWAKLRTRQKRGTWAGELPCALALSFHSFLPQEVSSLMASTNLLALTFLILGAGLGCLFHAPSLLIKAQCSSDVYSTGERKSKGEGEKISPSPARPCFSPKGTFGKRQLVLVGQGTFCSGTSSRDTVVTLSK